MKKKQPKNEPTLYKYCLRCGRKLVSLENRKRGMGKVCWEKSKVEKGKTHKLF